MSLSEAFFVFTVIKLLLHKSPEWSSLVSRPEAKSSSEINNLVLFTVSYKFSGCKEKNFWNIFILSSLNYGICLPSHLSDKASRANYPIN